MSGTITGDIALAWTGPVALTDPDAPDGVREIDQLNVTIKAEADEKEYQCVIPADKAPSEDECSRWMELGQKVTVYWSSVRQSVYGIDRTAKGPDGKPKYVPPNTRKVTVGKTTVEVGQIITLQGYKVEPAGQVDLADIGKAAHGAFLKQQADYKKRSVANKKARAAEQVKKRKEEAKAAKK